MTFSWDEFLPMSAVVQWRQLNPRRFSSKIRRNFGFAGFDVIPLEETVIFEDAVQHGAYFLISLLRHSVGRQRLDRAPAETWPARRN